MARAVKDSLLHSHTFGVVVSWMCSKPTCVSGFIAVVRATKMQDYIDALVGCKQGPLYKHMAESHDLSLLYPYKVSILSNKAEKVITALKTRLAIEMVANPLLICVSGDSDNPVCKDII